MPIECYFYFFFLKVVDTQIRPNPHQILKSSSYTVICEKLQQSVTMLTQIKIKQQN